MTKKIDSLIFHYAIAKYKQTVITNQCIEMYTMLDIQAQELHNQLLNEMNVSELDFNTIVKVENLVNEFIEKN